MSQFLYWPYDEVSFEKTDSGAIVKTPWLTAKLNLSEQDQLLASKIADKYKSQALGPEDIPLLNQLLQGLSHLPFCYILPTQKFAKDHHALIDKTLIDLELKDFLGHD